jgi:hypothetical protein
MVCVLCTVGSEGRKIKETQTQAPGSKNEPVASSVSPSFALKYHVNAFWTVPAHTTACSLRSGPPALPAASEPATGRLEAIDA